MDAGVAIRATRQLVKGVKKPYIQAPPRLVCTVKEKYIDSTGWWRRIWLQDGNACIVPERTVRNFYRVQLEGQGLPVLISAGLKIHQQKHGVACLCFGWHGSCLILHVRTARQQTEGPIETNR
ncbi:MAG: hypothetical protein ABFS24_15695, partial [Pseudomonadota bacterium]